MNGVKHQSEPTKIPCLAINECGTTSVGAIWLANAKCTRWFGSRMEKQEVGDGANNGNEGNDKEDWEPHKDDAHEALKQRERRSSLHCIAF